MSSWYTPVVVCVAPAMFALAVVILRDLHPLSRLGLAILAVGTVSHVENLLRLGLVPQPTQPVAFNAFWASLTLLDPLGVALLLARPRLGLGLTLAIMAVDLPVNLVAFVIPSGHGNGFFWSQLGFAAFATLVAATRWRSL